MPMTPAPDDVLTMAPPPDFSISGISCFMHRKTPRRSMSMIRFHSSSSYSAVGAGFLGSIPALLKAASSRPKTSAVLSRAAFTSSPRPHVAPDREGAAALFLDQACRFLIALVGYVGDDDARTLPGERQRRRPTDAARTAGDECDFPFKEISIVFHLLYSLVLWAQRRFDRPALIHGASTHCHIV